MAPLLLIRLLLHAVRAYMDWTWIALQCVVLRCACQSSTRYEGVTHCQPIKAGRLRSQRLHWTANSSTADACPASYRSSQQVSFGRHFACQMFPMDGHCTAGWQGINTFKALQYRHTNTYNSCTHNTPMASGHPLTKRAREYRPTECTRDAHAI